MGIHFVRRPTRLALLTMRSPTLRPARVLATQETILWVPSGVVAGLVDQPRFGRGLLAGMGYRAPVHRLLRARRFLFDRLRETL